MCTLYRELFVWLEMNASSSGTDFRRVDAGAARYGNAWLVEFFFDSCYSQGVTGCHMAMWSGNT